MFAFHVEGDLVFLLLLLSVIRAHLR